MGHLARLRRRQLTLEAARLLAPALTLALAACGGAGEARDATGLTVAGEKAVGAASGNASGPGQGAHAGGGGDAGRGPDGRGKEVPEGSAKIVGGYYPNWTRAPLRLRDVNSRYNLIYLFAARPVGGAPGTTGAVTFSLPGDGRGAARHLKADIAHARAAQQRKVILSVGGAGAGMSFPERGKSRTFVDSITELNQQLGPFDGLDWNTFEAEQAPDTSEMIWISLELKRRFPGFLITAPPAPWNQRDKDFCKAMVDAGALDYAAPQYYDGPELATTAYMTQSVASWAQLLGASRVVVGFGIWDQPNYMGIADAIATWQALELNHPSLRGAFDWQIHLDEAQGWAFAEQIGPLVTD